MINSTRVPATASIEAGKAPPGSTSRDELSMRLVEWALALVAIGAAVILAIR
jgi:hypothetical protein